MKKLIIAAVIALCGIFTSQAQFVNFRIEAGPGFNVAGLKLSGNAIKNFKAQPKVGYHVGAFVDIPVTGNVYVGSGLHFVMKGGKNQFDSNLLGDKTAVNDITLHYLQIPINIGFNVGVSRSVGIALHTGPYFAVALGGTQKTGILGHIETIKLYSKSLQDLGKNPSRFDMGWGLTGMAYLGNIYGSIGADFGFLNVLKNKQDNDRPREDALSLKNMTIYLGLGYRF